MGRIHQSFLAFCAVFALSVAGSLPANARDTPDSRNFDEQAIIDVTVGGIPARFRVDPGVTGPPVIDPRIAIKLKLRPTGRRNYQFGSFEVETVMARTTIDFGDATKSLPVAWSRFAVAPDVDGIIGAHDLPYRNVTFQLGESRANESVHSFKLTKKRAPQFTRLGTNLDVGGKKMFVIFSLDTGPNLSSARTANFLATYGEGGFVPDSKKLVAMIFGVRRETREMRLARPIFLGDLAIESFAVRVRDYGRPDKVGDLIERKPDNSAENIFVDRRKGKGRPDLLTRLGRDQLATCSRLTFDLKKMQGELSCAAT